MLHPFMTIEEINNEVNEEFHKLEIEVDRVINRYYNNERIRFKIDKENPYIKGYPYRTAKGNLCHIILYKWDGVKEYNGYDDASYTIVMPFEDWTGVRAVVITKTMKYVYNTAFFSSYNLQMNPRQKGPLDKMIHYFKKNALTVGGLIVAYDKEVYQTFSLDGAAFGRMEGLLVVVDNFIQNIHLTEVHTATKERLNAELHLDRVRINSTPSSTAI